MSYRSTLSYVKFVSRFSAKEINQKLKFEIDRGKDLLQYYYFEERDKVTGLYLIALCCDDWYGRHDGENELVSFIKDVIAEGYYTILSFEGEDGYRWGYCISKEFVYDVCYVESVETKDGNLTLEQMEVKYGLHSVYPPLFGREGE